MILDQGLIVGFPSKLRVIDCHYVLELVARKSLWALLGSICLIIDECVEICDQLIINRLFRCESEPFILLFEPRTRLLDASAHLLMLSKARLHHCVLSSRSYNSQSRAGWRFPVPHSLFLRCDNRFFLDTGVRDICRVAILDPVYWLDDVLYYCLVIEGDNSVDGNRPLYNEGPL